MKVVDPKGSWFVNKGQFPQHDPESNTRFEPGIPVKATVTDWLKGQPIIVAHEVEEAVAAPVKAAKEPKAPKA